MKVGRLFFFMRNRIMTFFFFTLFFLIVDAYVFQAVVNVSKDWSPLWRNIARYGFWVPTMLSVAALLWWAFDDPYRVSANVRNWIITGLVATYFSKMFGVLVLFIDDIQRGVRL